MKLSLNFREQIRGLGSFLVDELDNLVARIRAGWNVEHGPDGEHTAVNADTVSTGRLVFADIVSELIGQTQVDNYESGALDTAAILRLDSTGTEPISITGLKVPQDGDRVLDGRVLVLENISLTATFVLESEHTASFPRNRFRTPAHLDASDTSAPARIYLLPATLTTLIYNATLARWIVLSSRTEDNSRLVELSGANNNLEVGNLLSLKTLRLSFTATGGSISGVDSTNIPETTRLTVVNAGVYAFEVLHQNTGSSSSNRVTCPGGIRYRVDPREAFTLARTAEGWRIVEKASQWSDVVFSAGDYTATSGSWTLTSGDVTTLAYKIDGNSMTVSFHLTDTTVSATPTGLRVAIPGGRIAARAMRNALGSAVDNGTNIDTGFAFVSAGGTVIEFRKTAASTAWSAATNATSIAGQITFMIRDDDASISETHTDAAHGDTEHADGDHSDVSHVDTAHADTHSDTAHSDTAHRDSTSHTDSAHTDVAHSDIAHIDETVSHEDHTDSAHIDNPSSHSDVAHSDTAHSDSAHGDTSTHNDTAHVDTSHADTHSDTAHKDTSHADSTHSDTAHADTVHEDIGYHTDTSHADV
jgi:hypothetical protein